MAKQTPQKGANAHGHYTLSSHHNSIPFSNKLLVIIFYLQIYPSQAVGI